MKTRIIRCAGLAVMSMLAPAAMAAIWTVDKTVDDLPPAPPTVGSLRWAINQANGDPNSPVDIHFNVPTSLLTPPVFGGVAVIQPQTALPIIRNIHGHGITINGYTQPGSSYVAGAPSSLVVTVELDGSVVAIPTPPLYAHGLHIMSSANRVQGLCVHSFPHDGISIQGIPLSPSGPSGANGNLINWNLVGTDVSGTLTRPNGHGAGGLWGGIYIKVLPGMPGVANQNHILENVVSGNMIEGVGIANCPDQGSDVRNNHVERCYIGIDISGAGPLGNGHDGVYIGEGAHDNAIDQNWIGANGYSGVGIVGYGPSFLSTYANLLIHNKIGVDVNLNPMGNLRHGVAIGSYGGAVWGFAPSNKLDSNIIAWNGLTGVAVQEDPTVTGDNDTSFNTITANSIYQNGQVDPGHLGIDLIFEPGVTANDPGDTDAGPNQLVNFPVIGSAIYSAGTCTVSGTIDTPGYPVTIEVFTAMPGRDGSNHGQGAVFLGATTVSGPSWNVALTSGLPGQWLTATATDSAGNTSEFSLNAPVWDVNQQQVDYGDAPDPTYPTLIASGGPGHQIVPGMYLGNSVDGEPNGQPDATATGDDLDGNNDDDGVTFPLPLVPGQQAQIDVIASIQGLLNAWIDFDGNGNWAPAAEQILSNAFHPGGGMLMSHTFTVPPTAVVGNTFARIRYSTAGNLLPYGPLAPDGEVEDHMVMIQQGQEPEKFDWGDAPDPRYPTLAANNGAHHMIVPGIYLGNSVDGEPDGQPHPYAAGDDNAIPPGTDDEDGVIFLSPVVAGNMVIVQVTASVAGDLYGWVDFNHNGSWADPSEIVFNALSIPAGVSNLSFAVPSGATLGTTFARFRFTTVPNLALASTGPAPDGEVEDYILEIEDGSIDHKMHWAQLPDPTGWDVRGYFPKILADDFRCTESGPITQITFWGSWREDQVGQILNVHLSIHDDDRSGPFSKPGQLLWQADTAAGLIQFLPDPEPEFGDQGWFDPNTGQWFRPDHQQYFKYTVKIPENEAFVQEEGKIYWLDIQVTCEGGEWGWKTSRSAHFEDDAVWDDTPQDPVNWRELIDPLEQLSLDLAFVIGRSEEQADADYGDAPDDPLNPNDYPTLAASNGASHLLGSQFYLGFPNTPPDGEPDGQPTTNADGDDINGIDDEDGVTFQSWLIPGVSAAIRVDLVTPPGVQGYLNAWIDYNRNGNWSDPGEHFIIDQAYFSGTNFIGFFVPPGAIPGPTYARFRFTSQTLASLGLNEGGQAPDGEVEDYRIDILDAPNGVDFGDAPDAPYPTFTINDGARHRIVPGYQMGLMIDAEPDGQPSLLADGDDITPLGSPDDEDGVYCYPLIIGQQGAIDVSVSGSGFIDAWIDFNGNGSWLDAGEQIAAAVAVTAGRNQITFNLPAATVAGPSYARVRFSSAGGLAPTGGAQDGEVEDYRVDILPEGELFYDFGDAPDPSYPTLAASNGARHLIGGPLWLGQVVDPEPDGQPDPAALGDDNNLVYPGVPDDEDGVSFPYALIGGQSSLMQVTASAPGFIDVWIDWNANGSWADLGDNVLSAYPVNPGVNYVMIAVPPLTYTGPTMTRVRISSTGYLSPTGFAQDGEVEDHELFLYEEGGMDFGDAPDMSISPTTNYETTMRDLGAAHFIDSLFLGWLIDAEPDGQPSALADGDDLNPPAGLSDEDGVAFTSPWISGVAAQVNVTVNPAAAGPAYDLDLWVDWNGDGTWAQANEHVLAAIPVVPGMNQLTIPVPSGLNPFWTYARFRLTHPGTGVGYTGYVFGGEVEDYMIPIGMRVQAGISVNRSTIPPQAVLTWPAVTGAANYSIYSSTNLGTGFPNPPNWTLETTTASLTWSDPITVAKKFYIVVAFP